MLRRVRNSNVPDLVFKTRIFNATKKSRCVQKEQQGRLPFTDACRQGDQKGLDDEDDLHECE